MYKYTVMQEDIDILKQGVKVITCKVELLNHNMQIVDTLDGNLYNDSFSCDGESDVRRTLSFDMMVSDSTFSIGKDKKIWINRYVRVYYGVEVQRTGEIKEYLLGTFSFVDISTEETTSTKKISVTCSDMMAEFNGTKGGIMTYQNESEVTFKVTAGQSYREVLVGLMTKAGITSYEITGVDEYSIPYDIEWSVGTTFYDAWSQLRDLYKAWEFFFDEEGSFVWRKVATGYGEDVVLDDGVVRQLIISEKVSSSFGNIFNATEIWGQELDIVDDDRYAAVCSGGTSASDNIYSITLNNFTYSIALSTLTWVQQSTHLFRASVSDSLYYSYYKTCSARYSYHSGATPETLNNNSFVEYNPGSVKCLLIRDDSYSTLASFTSSLNQTLTYTNLDNLDSIAIKVSGAYGKYININNTINIPILTADASALAEKTYTPNTVYVFRYRRTASGTTADPTYLNFYLMGQYQAHGYYEENNVNVPYSIPNVGYKICKVIENDGLYSDELCNSQAKYETYQTTAKQDSMSLEMIIIPFLEPTQKISYTLLQSNEVDEWVVKSFSWSIMSGTMNVELYRFLEDYSYVVN